MCGGCAASGVAPAKVAALTEGVLKTMLLTKLKTVWQMAQRFRARGGEATAAAAAALPGDGDEHVAGPLRAGPGQVVKAAGIQCVSTGPT